VVIFKKEKLTVVSYSTDEQQKINPCAVKDDSAKS
jgi:hypothetical protein